MAGFRTTTTDDDSILTTLTTAGIRTSRVYSNLSFSRGNFWRVKALPSGQILTAGSLPLNARSNFFVSRLNANGTLDASFGTAGYSTLTTREDGGWGLRDFVLQADGKIVMTGGFNSNTDTLQNVGAARLLDNGSVDTTFNAAGTPGQNYLAVPNTVFVGTGRAARIQTDGKILIVSRFYSSIDNTATGRQAMIVRFNADGTVDTTYGGGGVAKTSFTGGSSQARAMDLDAAGRAVLTGEGSGQVRLARFTTSGVLDGTFGIGGMASFALPTGITLFLRHLRQSCCPPARSWL